MKDCLVVINDELSVMTAEMFHVETFSPDVTARVLFELSVSGSNYTERKSNLDDKAHIYCDATCEYSGLSYMEYSILDNFFEKNGKRYGLLEEFRENCIC